MSTPNSSLPSPSQPRGPHQPAGQQIPPAGQNPAPQYPAPQYSAPQYPASTQQMGRQPAALSPTASADLRQPWWVARVSAVTLAACAVIGSALHLSIVGVPFVSQPYTESTVGWVANQVLTVLGAGIILTTLAIIPLTVVMWLKKSLGAGVTLLAVTQLPVLGSVVYFTFGLLPVLTGMTSDGLLYLPGNDLTGATAGMLLSFLALIAHIALLASLVTVWSRRSKSRRTAMHAPSQR